MWDYGQARRSFTASSLRLLICTVLASTTFPLRAEAVVQTPRIDDPDVPKIDLLLSGGGLRASAFSYGVLAGLNEVCIPTGQGNREWGKREIDSEGNLLDCGTGYTSLLDHVNILSAVSGGAITAAYFKSHQGEFFEEFPKLLKNSHMGWQLFKAGKPLSWKRFLRSPLSLVTSIFDTITAFVGIPLSLFNLNNIELTPLTVMVFSDGLLESEQLTTVYKDLFYQDTRFKDLSKKNGFPFEALARTGQTRSSANNPTLLINATDITSGTVFTFDERTFECMGVRSERDNVELALAVAASSNLPGVFSPIRIDDLLERADPQTIPGDCPTVLADRTRSPVLVDGGVTDNLGAIGLLRTVIKRKEDFLNKDASDDLRDHDPRGEKHLLLIINSEAESGSRLPGLAGHSDASYDVLIRSKKDLVRVMASDMFSHFGFSTMEFRLSDLVTSEPGIEKIVSREVERLAQGKIKEETVAEKVVPRAMQATEHEQRIKRELDEVGMLPTPDEIDTLIAAGRKVVANRHKDLEKAFKTLTDKLFESNCSGIVNPDKYFCWPDRFRSYDLYAGGGSAFLQTLADAAKDFVEATERSRQELIREVRLESLKAIQDENTEPDSTTGESTTALINYIHNVVHATSEGDFPKGLIDKENNLRTLYEIFQEQPPLEKACKDAIDVLQKKVRSKIPDNPNSSDKTDSWDKLSPHEISSDLRKVLESEDVKPSSCHPFYYYLLTLPRMFEKKSPDRDTDLLAPLYEGLIKVDSKHNTMMLHHVLGVLLVLESTSFQQGIEHLEHATSMAVGHEARIHRLQNDPAVAKKREDLESLEFHRQRMHLFQIYNKILTAYAVILSPMPLPGDIGDVRENAVLDWELKNLPTKRGKSLLQSILVHGVKTFEKDLLKGIELIQIQHQKYRNKHLMAIQMELCKLLEAYYQHMPIPMKRPASCSDSEQKISAPAAIEAIRSHIRAHLAETSGILETEESVKSIYAEYIEWKSDHGEHMEESKKALQKERNNSFTFMEPDILLLYGFFILTRDMQAPCPTRAKSVHLSEVLFREAKGLPHVGDALGKRTDSYLTLAHKLQCPGPL